MEYIAKSYEYIAKVNFMKKIIFNILSESSKQLPIYMFSVGSNYSQEELNRPNGCEFHQILFVIDGMGVLNCCGQIYELKRGCAFFTSKDIPVSYKSTDGLITAFLTVSGEAVDNMMHYFESNGFLFRESIDTDKYLSDIDEIKKEYHSHKRNGILSALCYSFYMNFFEEQTKEFNQMNEISLYIEKNFTKKLTLKKISDLFGISVSKLSHEFKKEFGYTVFEYILNLRLTYSRNLILLNPDTKIKDAALSCGFDDISYFCKAYRAKFGITPSKDKS